jgi:hypothetical protein
MSVLSSIAETRGRSIRAMSIRADPLDAAPDRAARVEAIPASEA